MLTLLLILGLFSPGVRSGFMGVVIIVSIVSLYFYGRRVVERTQAHAKERERINIEIASLIKNELPSGFEFLLDGPTFTGTVVYPTMKGRA
jgi:hypothetical protein